MDNILVSIIIPTHNKGLYIKDAIDSALNQTWENIEIIIVDDSSTDRTIEILNSIQNKRVKVYHKSFRNASASRNFGLANANGSFIQFLDADDILDPDKIKCQLRDMDFQENVLGVCNTQIFYQDIHESYPELDKAFLSFSTDPKLFIINLYKAVDSGMVQPNAWLTPIHVIKKAGVWNETLSLDDDGEFFCRVILESHVIVHTDKVLNYYRKFHLQKNNLSASNSEKSFQSSYESAVLKMLHLKKKIILPDTILQPVFNALFVNVMVSAYPKYKHISKAAEMIIDDKYPIVLPKIGGSIVESLKFLIGWKNTKKFKNFLQNKSVNHLRF